MVDPTPVTPKRRAALVVALIVGLPLTFTLIGLIVAGPLSSDEPLGIPTDCGEAFVDESPEVRSTSRVFAEVARVRLFDCKDRFVAAVDGVGDATAAFTVGGEVDRMIVSVTLIDEFGSLHEQRTLELADGRFTAVFERASGAVGDVPLEAVAFEGSTVVLEFPRGRGEQRLAAVEVSMTERSGNATVHDDFTAEF